MNVIEKYAQLFSQRQVDESLFRADGLELCPADGTRPLKAYAQGLPSDDFRYIEKIELLELICKTASVAGCSELHGVARFKLFWKVEQGLAEMSMIQVLQSNDGLIYNLNSFWDFAAFSQLCESHPELKRVFNKTV